ncbi:MAG: transporter [Planctomycetota bacterium]
MLRPPLLLLHATVFALASSVSASAQGVLAGGWLEPWPHHHMNPRGTPYVHAFGVEPAFLERDLLLDLRRTTTAAGRELEAEAELEWAFTKRLGLVVELPFLHVNERGSGEHTGFGDLGLAPRALLVDSDEFLLAFNVGVEVPTGDEDRGLGAGETVLAPSFSLWLDLGDVARNPVTFQAQVGTEHGLETGDTTLFYNAALALSFVGTHHEPSTHAEHQHEQLAPGMTHLLLELTGRTVLDGPDEETTAEMLFGVSFNATAQLELRAGYVTSIGGPQEIEDGFALGVIHHF